jgi:hypothetical protein
VAPTAAEEEAAAVVLTEPMFGHTALQAPAFARPLLGIPALIIVAPIVETPVLRCEPATPRCRTAARALAIIALIVAAPLAVMSWALGVFGLLLLRGLIVPSILTLARLRQLPPTEPTS